MKHAMLMLLQWLMVAVALIVLAGCDSSVKQNPTPRDFVGIWTGKWDDKWAVRFSISQNLKTGDLQAIYEWEERAGELFLKEVLPATIDGNVLHVGEKIRIVISAVDENQAEAVGSFRHTRRASLQRQLGKVRP